MGDRASLNDKIQIDNRFIHLALPQTRRVLIYNKPEGLICTRNDPQKRPNVFQHLPKLTRGRWIMVGRLDINTQGLLIFTNDGVLANQLMHPRHEIEREYAVRILGKVDAAMIERLKKGITLKEGKMRFASVIRKPTTGANQWFHVVLKEGKYREVRRLWEALGVKVSRLIRVRFGNVELPRNLSRGRWRELTEKDPFP